MSCTVCGGTRVAMKYIRYPKRGAWRRIKCPECTAKKTRKPVTEGQI